jgi:hypothetical protein
MHGRHFNLSTVEYCKMKNDTQSEKLANRIAAAIVAHVEHKNGPITLLEIARVIPDFAGTGQMQSDWVTADGETVIWSGMTEAGRSALAKVLNKHEVAVQFGWKPYLFEGCRLKISDGLPLILIPKRAANVETKMWLMRVSETLREACIKRGALENKTARPLTPRPIRFTADQYML